MGGCVKRLQGFSSVNKLGDYLVWWYDMISMTGCRRRGALASRTSINSCTSAWLSSAVCYRCGNFIVPLSRGVSALHCGKRVRPYVALWLNLMTAAGQFDCERWCPGVLDFFCPFNSMCCVCVFHEYGGLVLLSTKERWQ